MIRVTVSMRNSFSTRHADTCSSLLTHSKTAFHTGASHKLWVLAVFSCNKLLQLAKPLSASANEIFTLLCHAFWGKKKIYFTLSRCGNTCLFMCKWTTFFFFSIRTTFSCFILPLLASTGFGWLLCNQHMQTILVTSVQFSGQDSL